MRPAETARYAATVILIALALTGCKKGESQADKPRLTTQVSMRDVTFHSAALNREMEYRVVLPSSVAPGQKLSVVYLLHGGGGGFRDWSNYSDVARFAEQGLLLVMPEGDSSYYVNSASEPQDRYEDYIVNDLLSEIQSKFLVATGRSNRAIVGVSMGGFGAVKIALSHPDLFAFAAGISSAIDVPSRPFSAKRISQWRHHSAIFGPWKSKTRRDNDPFVLTRSVDPKGTPYFYLSCGEQEGLLPANRQFAALLAQRQFQYEFHTGPGGHDWNQWNGRLTEVFQSLQKHLSGENGLTRHGE